MRTAAPGARLPPIHPPVTTTKSKGNTYGRSKKQERERTDPGHRRGRHRSESRHHRLAWKYGKRPAESADAAPLPAGSAGPDLGETGRAAHDAVAGHARFGRLSRRGPR